MSVLILNKRLLIILYIEHWPHSEHFENVVRFKVRRLTVPGKSVCIAWLCLFRWTGSDGSASDILNLKRRFVKSKEESSKVFFMKRQTRLTQQREVGSRSVLDLSHLLFCVLL